MIGYIQSIRFVIVCMYIYSARYFYFIGFCLGSRCMAVDREFACMVFRCVYIVFLICFSPLCVFLLGSFSSPWCDFGLPFVTLSLGRLGFTRGSAWAHFGFPLAFLGCRWPPLGHLGFPSGAWDDFGPK
jgi:hypothetical protein